MLLRYVRARFLIQHCNCPLVQRFCVCVRIANSSHPCPSQLAQCAHHVEHYACLAGLTEVQIVSHHNVEQIVRSQSAIPRRFDVIAGNKKFLLAVRSREDAGLDRKSVV